MANQVEEDSALEAGKKEITLLLNKKMAKGQTWYLISMEWWRQLLVYIDTQLDEENGTCASPGPIDNSALLDENGELKENLVDRQDYELVPEEAWAVIVKWFGKVPGQDPLKRKVIELGESKHEVMVEVYPVNVKVCKNFDFDNYKVMRFSHMDTIGKVREEICRVFNITEETETKLCLFFMPSDTVRLDKYDKTLHDVRVSQGQTIVIATPTPKSINQGQSILMDTPNSPKGMFPVVPFKRDIYTMGTVGDRRQAPKPGLCGLCNLGNTCFMNSVLQCLSNCPPLTEYFVRGEHYREINTDNPIGMGGEIAKSYGELIQNMWSGKSYAIAPHSFKVQVGRFAPRFSGYQQHDSQELLTFLLDGLHEDLNRIKDKPYMEEQDGDGLPDKELAKLSWENYLKRNDSVIIDLFHGLLKSTVVCPDCNKTSGTFDPFCYLSLPFPQKKERLMEIVLVHADPMKAPVRYKLAVPKKGTVRDLCTALNEYTQIPEDHMFVAKLSRNHFHSAYSLNYFLTCIDDKDDIFIYELSIGSNQTDQKVVPVCMWQSDHVDGSNEVFGIPFMITVPLKSISYDTLYSTIMDRMQRFVCYSRPNSNPKNSEKEVKNNCQRDSWCEMDDFYSDEAAETYLFSIHKLSKDSEETEKLDPSAGPIDFSTFLCDQYLAIKWTRRNRTMYVNDNLVNSIMPHDSLKQRRSVKLHLKDCLDLYAATEELGVENAWYCPKCKKHQRATKKFDLWTLPKVLIIQLKRFSYNRFKRDKIDSLVDFPLHELDMKDYVINHTTPPAPYDLIAVCNHYGGMGGGHYTAYAKNMVNKEWYCFDDNNVTSTGKEHVVSSAAYLLFYVQRHNENSTPCLNHLTNSGLSDEADKCSDEEME